LSAGLEPLFIDMQGARWTAGDRYEPAKSARRFEDWEFPYALLLASAEATRYALAVGVERAQARCSILAARLRARLEHDGLRILDRGAELGALVTAEIPGWQPEPFKRALDATGVNSSLSYFENALRLRRQAHRLVPAALAALLQHRARGRSRRRAHPRPGTTKLGLPCCSAQDASRRRPFWRSSNCLAYSLDSSERREIASLADYQLGHVRGCPQHGEAHRRRNTTEYLCSGRLPRDS
jgi:hypothetical protein